MKKEKVKALVSEFTIVLKMGKDVLNIQKATQKKTFLKIEKAIKEGDEETLIKEFNKKSKQIVDFAGNDFEVRDGNLFLKKYPKDILPKAIAKKLAEMKDANIDYSPLIKFWEKLRMNPSEQSKKELYLFMIHNNIPLTNDGDIVCEKGVRENESKKLVDCHSRTIDNSIGTIVSMKRELVNPDRNQTCSKGLHVAPPDYVRKWYNNDIIIECVINPKDVVSVPVDYNNQKMRVCSYYVSGYAPKSRKKPLIKDYDELLEGNSIPPVIPPLPKIQFDSSEGYEVVTMVKGLEDTLTSMTGKEILNYVLKQTGVNIISPDATPEELTRLLKNKKGLIKKAIIILVEHQKEVEKAKLLAENSTNNKEKSVIFTGLKAKEIVARVKKDFKIVIGGKDPRRARVLTQAIKMYAEKGIKVID